jgi:membrane associated rhomboid family serine protease
MNPYNQPDPAADSRRLRQAFAVALSFVVLLWMVKLTEVFVATDFIQLGIYPRRASGLIGILCAPLIHSSFAHLFANSAPILVTGTMLLYGYPRAARVVLPLVYLGSGIAVWLFAREAYHIGASGLVFGMLLFVFTAGVLQWGRRAIALSLAVFFLYGGMLMGVLPVDQDISFESHLAGALIGLVLAFRLRQLDPAPAPKQYSWELEEEEIDPDSVIEVDAEVKADAVDDADRPEQH